MFLTREYSFHASVAKTQESAWSCSFSSLKNVDVRPVDRPGQKQASPAVLQTHSVYRSVRKLIVPMALGGRRGTVDSDRLTIALSTSHDMVPLRVIQHDLANTAIMFSAFRYGHATFQQSPRYGGCVVKGVCCSA
jgi:hypothetical protein